MLKLITKGQDLDPARLAGVYAESIRDMGEFYGEVYDFLSEADTLYAVWLMDGKYACALRLEPYQDGLLIAGLETAPDLRGRGCAKALLRAVASQFSGRRLYSHVARKNTASLAVHADCGFTKLHDGAILLDGSAGSSYVTLCNKNDADT